MKQNISTLLLVGLMIAPTLSSAKSSSTTINQDQNANQNVSCGVTAPVNMTVTGGGTVNVGSPVCVMDVGQYSTQGAQGSSSAH